MTDEAFQSRRPMNDLPDELFVNVNIVDGIYGPGADGLYVCPDHKGRALPCRSCLYGEVAKTPYMFFRDYNRMIVLDALHSAFDKYADDHSVWYHYPNPYGTATLDGRFDLDEIATMMANELYEKRFH